MAKKIIKAQMKQRQDTKANWAAVNPVLLDGELGMVSDDHNLYKVGDGRTAWNDLPFRGFDGTLAQELGTSTNAAISQKAVTEKLTELSAEMVKANSTDIVLKGSYEPLDISLQKGMIIESIGEATGLYLRRRIDGNEELILASNIPYTLPYDVSAIIPISDAAGSKVVVKNLIDSKIEVLSDELNEEIYKLSVSLDRVWDIPYAGSWSYKANTDLPKDKTFIDVDIKKGERYTISANSFTGYLYHWINDVDNGEIQNGVEQIAENDITRIKFLLYAPTTDGELKVSVDHESIGKELSSAKDTINTLRNDVSVINDIIGALPYTGSWIYKANTDLSKDKTFIDVDIKRGEKYTISANSHTGYLFHWINDVDCGEIQNGVEQVADTDITRIKFLLYAPTSDGELNISISRKSLAEEVEKNSSQITTLDAEINKINRIVAGEVTTITFANAWDYKAGVDLMPANTKIYADIPAGERYTINIKPYTGELYHDINGQPYGLVPNRVEQVALEDITEFSFYLTGATKNGVLDIEIVKINKGKAYDFSSNPYIAMPIPQLAKVNILARSLPTTKTADIKAIMEFDDGRGNLFKKKIIINAQGTSSLPLAKKNFSVDIMDENFNDSHSIKFGDWVAQDGFHIKAYMLDGIRVKPLAAYDFYESILKTRGAIKDRVWKRAQLPISIPFDSNNIADAYLQIDNGAKNHPMGFPFILYYNDEFYGIYCWQLKKHRDNYHQKKSKAEHIHLDGNISNVLLWEANGAINWDKWAGKIPESDTSVSQEGIEVRNPKKLILVDGSEYDADTNTGEFISFDSAGYDASNADMVRTASVRASIESLSSRVYALTQMVNGADKKAAIAEVFDVDSIIDYIIFSQITGNDDGYKKNWQWVTYDGVKWAVNAYDLDGVWGWNSWNYFQPYKTWIHNDTPPITLVIETYLDEIKERYAELRDKGVIALDKIMQPLMNYVRVIGLDFYEQEFERWTDGARDNLWRFESWMKESIRLTDILMDYNS